MKTHAEKSQSFSWVAVLIVLIGFGLRVYQLGHSSFWNDEAGQALAATQPTIAGMLEISRSHAMAMPLDYFVSRAVGLIGTTEFMLRFPAAIWGTLLLPLFFVLARRLAGRPVALLAVLILALSPLHLRYSQEMRYYAALCFFYILSTITLFAALKRGRLLDWGIYIFVTSVGAYFHPYVLLSIFSGLGSLLFLQLAPARRLRMFGVLIACGLILGILFLPGYVYFGGQQVFHYDLLQFYGSIQNVVFQGLGWFAFPYTETTPLVGMWELLNIVFAAIGFLAICVRREKYALVLGLLAGGVVQVLLILGADAIKGYWFLARQLLHLALLPILLVAIGMVNLPLLVERVRFHFKQQASSKFLRYGLSLALVGALCAAAVPRIADYYHYQKSSGRQVVSQLLLSHHAGEPILVIPAHEGKIYQFYLLQAQAADLIGDLKLTTWQELPALMSNTDGKIYLATPAKLSDEQRGILEKWGFADLLGIDHPWYGMHTLFAATVSRKP